MRCICLLSTLLKTRTTNNRNLLEIENGGDTEWKLAGLRCQYSRGKPNLSSQR